jgi:hypothetical protein
VAAWSEPTALVDRALAGVAARLGILDPARLETALRGVPAPGPAAPAALLDPDAGRRRPAAPAAARGTPRHPAGRGLEPDRPSRSSRPVGGAESVVPARDDLAEEPGAATARWVVEPGTAGGLARRFSPAPPPDRATGADELGRRPGERPAGVSHERVAGPGTELDRPGSAAVASTASQPGVPDSELEQAMQRILNDAARRHGIEV